MRIPSNHCPRILGRYSLAYHRKGQFFALDAVTGKTLWSTQGREADNTAIVKAGGLLFLLNDAELIVARASRDSFEPIRRYTVADSATRTNSGHAALGTTSDFWKSALREGRFDAHPVDSGLTSA